MFDRTWVSRVLLAAILLAAPPAWADSLTTVTSSGAQLATDSVNWTQLGADQATIPASFTARSVKGMDVSGGLTAGGSIVSVDCTATPCSWTGSGFTAGDRMIWTSDTGNGGNGPLTLSFGNKVSGAGALIQATGPGQFSIQIQAFNGGALLGTVNATSNTAGDATYLGVIDNTGANIDKIIISLTSVTQGRTTDFAIDTVYLKTGLGPTATPTKRSTPIPTKRATPTSTRTATPSRTRTPISIRTTTPTPTKGATRTATRTATPSRTRTPAPTMTATPKPTAGLMVSWYGCMYHATDGHKYQAVEFQLSRPATLVLQGEMYYGPNCDPAQWTDQFNDYGTPDSFGTWAYLFWFIYRPDMPNTSVIWTLGNQSSGCINYNTAPICY